MGIQQEVCFTRYDILQRLGWAANQSHYAILQTAFERLKGVVITSQNAFWDAEAQSFVNVGFNLIDNYRIVAEKAGRKSQQARELPLSYFRWNDVIFKSLRSGYIRSLDLGFALSLSLPLSLRLYRYLDKKTHDGKTSFEIELHRLCELHLGMKPSPHNSTLKVRLKDAHQELIDRGFLTGVSYHPMRSKKAEKVCYSFPSHRSPEALGASPAIPELAPPPVRTPPAQASAHVLLSEDHVPESISESAVFKSVDQPSSTAAPKRKRAAQAKEKAPVQKRAPRRARAKPTGEPAGALAEVTALEPKAESTVATRLEQEKRLSKSDSPLGQRLGDLGLDAVTVEQLLEEHKAEHLEMHLECLADRRPRDPASLFLYALRRDLPPPPSFLDRFQSRAEGPAELLQTGSESGLASTERLRARWDEARSRAGAAAAFFESLPRHSQTHVRARVRAELQQMGVQSRLVYPNPTWVQVLTELLRDEEWSQSVLKLQDEAPTRGK
jgi:aryl carrier-like protein